MKCKSLELALHSNTITMNPISLLKEQKYHTTILLCLIIFLAAFLRLYYLSAPSFSSDEVVCLKFFQGPNTIYESTAFYAQPPIYFYILHYWISIAGTSVFALRLPTAIFGILSVFALFKLASLIFDNKTALIGALLMAVNPEHFFHSFLFRQYTLTVLLGLLSIYLLLRALQSASGGHTILWIAFGISNVALLFTHHSAIFVVLTEIFYIALVFRRRKYTLQIFSAIAVICLSGAAILFLQKRDLQRIFSENLGWIAKPTFETFLNELSSFIAGFYIKMPNLGIIFADGIFFKSQGPYIDALPLPAKISIFAFFSAFLLLGIFKYFWNNKQDAPSSSTVNCKPLMYFWGTIPIISTYAFSFLVCPIFGPTRYQLFWSCSILLLIAKGFAATKKLRFICPILFITVCIYLYPILTYESNPRILNWKGVANYLEETVSDGETIHYLHDDYAAESFRYYYKKDIYYGISEIFKQLTPNIRNEGSKGIFLIEVGTDNPHLGLTSNLETHYSNKETKQFHHINVTHYWKPKMVF